MIEDNPGDARLVELSLVESDVDFDMINEDNLEKGINAYIAAPFDVVLLDLTLPDSRGFDTLKKFLEHCPGANVIVLTGMQDKKIGIESVRAGAQDYLVKGQSDPDWLLKALRYSIERNRVKIRLEETQQSLKEAQTMAKIGNWRYNPQTNSFSASDEFYRIVGFPKEHAVFDLHSIIDASSPLFFLKKSIDIALSDGSHTDDFKYNHPQSEGPCYLKVESNAKGAEEGKKVQGILQNITESKQKDELEVELGVALEAAKIKESLLARVSHEMRTPMNGIINTSRLALKTQLNTEQKEHLRTIMDTSEHLLVIINDILQISTIQNGKVEFEYKPFDLFDKLSNLYNLNQYKIEEKDIQFEVKFGEGIPRVLIGDPNRLNQILINLVGNAFKFTHSGTVTVSASRLPHDKEGEIRVLFEVEDTGIGIPDEKVNEVFKPFNRVEYKEQLYEGTGLGLSIASSFVKLQGGDIGVESKHGKGSRFYFDLPFTLTDAQLEEKTEDKVVSISTIRDFKILLAEDNKLNQMVAKKHIESEYENIKVTIAENGKEAITILSEEDFDVVLMDLHMPVMDGYEATEYIRDKFPASKKDIPILAMTADIQISENGKFRQFRMDDFVLKPFEPNQLYEKLARYINKIGN